MNDWNDWVDTVKSFRFLGKSFLQGIGALAGLSMIIIVGATIAWMILLWQSAAL